jgi:hypothetical protein
MRNKKQDLRMEFIRKYRFEIALLLPIIVLVVIRSMGLNHFRNDAKRWAGPSVKATNLLSAAQAGTLSGNILIINLDKNSSSPREITGDVQNIPADSVLSKKYISLIKNHDGPVLISSMDTGLSARIWMILSQMGCQSVYIYTKASDNEVLKYKFQPENLSTN